MVQQVGDKTVTTSVFTQSTSQTPPPNDHDSNYNPKDGSYKSYPSDTVAAVTIAVLAVIIIITMLIVFRALRKRQRARRGERFGVNVIPTITTGVMGSGGTAYSSNPVNSVPVRGAVRWETVNPSSSTDNDLTDLAAAPR